MKNYFLKLTVVTILSSLALIKAETYEGYKLYHLAPTKETHLKVIQSLSLKEQSYDFLNLEKVMVSPNDVEQFEDTMKYYDLSFELMDDNVGKTIKRNFDMNRLMKILKPYNGQGRLSTDRYYSHDEINAYLEDLANRFPQRVFLKNVGWSFEERTLKTITITNGDGRLNKNVILVDGGFHANEWISPASAVYAIEQLVENFDENKELLEDFHWVVLPVVNPDGYEYTQRSVDNRMWRKTRKPLFHEGGICYGTDPNRNFDFHWNGDGASSDPCSNTFAGPKAFSEPETMIVRDLIHSFSNKGQMYLTIHSYGSMILYPWGWSSYKLYNLRPTREKHFKIIENLSLKEQSYDFLNSERVIVNPDNVEQFENTMNYNDLSFELIDDNVGKTLTRNFEMNRLMKNLKPYKGQGRLSTDRYYSHDEINAYLDDLANRFPQRVFLKNVGWSFENRRLKTITITNGDSRSNKNIIFVDGGFHAREWISPASAIYAIEQLVENFDENKELLEDYHWVVLPVVNADGYEYTQRSADTRMWRKTRKPLFHEGGICYGTDPNRNFDFHWNEEGASSDPCANTFAGPKAFSEPETMVVRDLIHSFSEMGQMYLTLHSQGKLILYPWGWSSDLPDTWEDLHEVAEAGAEAIYAATGTNYTIGSSTNVLYVAAGASDDYAFNAGFPISFTMELPGAGSTGFDPPVEMIDELVKETWVGIKAMGLKVIQKYPLN